LNLFKGNPRGYGAYIDLPDGSYNSFGAPRTRLQHRLSRDTDARSITNPELNQFWKKQGQAGRVLLTESTEVGEDTRGAADWRVPQLYEASCQLSEKP
jgi:hypothetical protein